MGAWRAKVCAGDGHNCGTNCHSVVALNVLHPVTFATFCVTKINLSRTNITRHHVGLFLLFAAHNFALYRNSESLAALKSAISESFKDFVRKVFGINL